MSRRQQNERDYPFWEDLPDGGRRYWKEVPGKIKNRARYIKIVDADENTLSYVQEIYDDDGQLIEQHQKYPVDTGHQSLREAEGDGNGNGHAPNGGAKAD